MASIFTHPAPALALAAGLGTRVIPPRLVVATVLASILPDLDVAGFAFGVRYAEILGHRGLSHSLAFALGIGLLGFLAAPLLKSRRPAAFVALFLAVLSHITLDALTTGGLGVAFFWPIDHTRYFLPWRPIVVSPFSPKAFLSSWGARVILSELRWVWTPCAAFAVAGIIIRRMAGSTPGISPPRYPRRPGDPIR